MKKFLALCVLSTGIAAFAQTAADSNLRTQANLRGINVGVAVTFPNSNRAAYDSALSQNFNTLVPENAMKIANTENVRGVFTFTSADAIVDFAESHGQKMRGHTLVWHSQAGFMANLNVPRDTMLAIMKNHINVVMGRYKGRILEWDVVNEAIGQNGAASPNIRNSFWVTRIGTDFIDSAFVFAHRADSNALLYYNDFGGESMNDSDPNSKSKNVYDLVKGLKQRGVPIHGIGLQSHLSGNFDTAAIGNNMRRLAALGLRISITELDIPNSGTVDSAKLALQKQRYKSLMALCLSVPQCKTFMVWGLNDNQSWLGASSQALLFNGSTTQNKKPAYFGVVEALREAGPVVPVVPGAPTGLSSVVPANGTLRISWSAPAFDGGVAITGYKAMIVGADSATKFCTTSGARTCDISGLTAGTSYSYTVRAGNSVGFGPTATPVTGNPTSVAAGKLAASQGRFNGDYSYQISEDAVRRTSELSLTVSDVNGHVVWQNTLRPSQSGIREVSWNGNSASGTVTPPGMYILHIRTIQNGQRHEATKRSLKLR